jgi:hypothetical protein
MPPSSESNREPNVIAGYLLRLFFDLEGGGKYIPPI